MNSTGVFVIDAADAISAGVPSDTTVPTAEVAWPDGRTDALPHTCEALDVYGGGPAWSAT